MTVDAAAGDLVTENGQIQWRGLLLGAGTRYRKKALEGWLDRDDARDGDVDLDDDHGAVPGLLLDGPRVVTLTLKLYGRSGFHEAVQELRRATANGPTAEEEPLVVQTAGVKAMAWARCIGRIIPQDLDWSVGYTEPVIRWKATNPRLLQLPGLSPSTTPPGPGGGGLKFPLRFPLTFGAAPAGGELVLTNAGGAWAQPVWRITGPCTAPQITNADTGARLWFREDYTVPAGQELDLATEDKSVLVRPVGSTATGVSRSNQLERREWFQLAPGVTRVRFDSADGGGTLRCLYHHTDQ